MFNININKLRSEVEEREQRKIKIYEKVLNLCYQKILNTNKQYDDYTCTYIVPNVVFGLPLYNFDECVQFIMNKLIEKGFEIIYAIPNIIHISWKPVEKNINKQLYIPQNKYIEYKSNNKSNHNANANYNPNANANANHNANNKSHMQNFKSVDDYSESKSLIYDTDDINLFQSKLDSIFN
jgi:hypothetical protein